MNDCAIGIKVRDVHFPQGGGSLSVIIQVEPHIDGQVTDALLAVLGSPWPNTKMAIAVDPDINIYDYRDVHYALATRRRPQPACDHDRQSRGFIFDPRPQPVLDAFPHTVQDSTSRRWWASGASTPPSPSRTGPPAKELRTCMARLLGPGEARRLSRTRMSRLHGMLPRLYWVISMSAAVLVIYDGKPEDPEQFLRYYIDVHIPLVWKFPGIRAVQVEHTVEGDVFMIARFLFDTPAAARAALDSPKPAVAAPTAPTSGVYRHGAAPDRGGARRFR